MMLLSRINMTFEDNIKKIEDIINQLEKGDIPLNKAIELYNEGNNLVNESKKELDQAKLLIKEYGEENDGDK